MSDFVSVVFCRVCGSRYVEISEWNDKENKAVIRCRTCNASEETSKFTLGRCSVTGKELQSARESVAKKGHYEK
jgi:hypothetical protein